MSIGTLSHLLEILEEKFLYEDISFGVIVETLGRVTEDRMNKFILEGEELEIAAEDLPKVLNDYFEMLNDTEKEEIEKRVEKILKEKLKKGGK